MSVQERLQLWDDVLAFSAALPADGLKQEYILAWLETYQPSRRMDLYHFLAGDTFVAENGQRMKPLPSDPGERAEFLDFLATWGGDTRQCAEKGTAVFSVWYHLTDGTSMWAVHIACLVDFRLVHGRIVHARDFGPRVGRVAQLHPPRAAHPVRSGHDANDPAHLPDDRALRGNAFARCTA